jgi:hypothetical protein
MSPLDTNRLISNGAAGPAIAGGVWVADNREWRLEFDFW